MENKKCIFCNEEKNVSEFYYYFQSKKLATGEVKKYKYYKSYCIECCKSDEYRLKVLEAENKKELLIDRLIKFAKSKGFKHLSHARDVIGLNELKKMYYEENN